MATIKDIARAAGVSQATVSNVLNKRGNVSSQKIRLVEQAAAAMGYRLNEAASVLRSGKVRMVAVVLPDIQSSAYADLYEGICAVAKPQGYTVMLHTTRNVLEEEKQVIRDVASSRAACAIVVSSLPNPGERYASLMQGGTRVRFAERCDMDDEGYIGFDVDDAARQLARRALADGARHIGLMTGPDIYPSEARFLRAFGETLAQGDSPPMLHAVQAVASQYTKRAFQLGQGDVLPDAIVTTCEEMAQAVLASYRICPPERMPLLYTLSSARMLAPCAYVRYAMDRRQLGRMLATAILDKDGAQRRCVLPAQGFRQTKARAGGSPGQVLNILMPDSPNTTALQQLLPHLKKRTGIEARIVTLHSRNIKQTLEKLEGMDAYDVVRMDMAQLDWLAQRLFCPLDQLPLALDEIKARLLPEILPEFMQVGGVDYTLPFDPSLQMLFYRQDLFEDAQTQRAYLERTKRPLEVPADYAAYAETARFFDRRFRPENKVHYGCVLTYLSGEYMAHFIAAMGGRQLDSFLRPELREALSQHALLYEASAGGRSMGWWGSAVEQFATGDSAMTIAYANHAELLSENPLSRVSGRVGYAQVPGGVPMIGGGVMGVCSTSRNKEAAAAFLEWLYSDEISRLLALLGGCSPCTGAYEDGEILDVYPWLPTVRAGFASGMRRGIFAGVRMPFDQVTLEDGVGFAAMNVMQGVMTPEQALAYADGLYETYKAK